MWLTSIFWEFISNSCRPLAERFEKIEAWQDSRNKSEHQYSAFSQSARADIEYS